MSDLVLEESAATELSEAYKGALPKQRVYELVMCLMTNQEPTDLPEGEFNLARLRGSIIAALPNGAYLAFKGPNACALALTARTLLRDGGRLMETALEMMPATLKSLNKDWVDLEDSSVKWNGWNFRVLIAEVSRARRMAVGFRQDTQV